MASRWMQPKLDKIRRARKFTPHDTKYRAGHTIERPNHVTREVAEACNDWLRREDHKVTKVADGAEPRRIGKQRRELNTATYGNGERITRDWRTNYVAAASVLIRNGVVVG